MLNFVADGFDVFPLDECSVVSAGSDDFVALVGVEGSHSFDFVGMPGHPHAWSDGVSGVEFADWIVEEAHGSEVVADHEMAVVVLFSYDVHRVDVVQLDPALDVEVLFVPAELRSLVVPTSERSQMQGAVDHLEGLGDIEEEFSVGGIDSPDELGASAPVNRNNWFLVHVVDGPEEGVLRPRGGVGPGLVLFVGDFIDVNAGVMRADG